MGRSGDEQRSVCGFVRLYDPAMYEIAPEYAEEFEYGNWEVFSIHAAPEKYYRAIYHLIMQGADRLESVKPFKAALKVALEADPRFKST